MVEEVPSYLYPGLVSVHKCNKHTHTYHCFCVQAQLHKKSSTDAKEVMLKLVSWTLQCLDLEMTQQLPISVSLQSTNSLLIPSNTHHCFLLLLLLLSWNNPTVMNAVSLSIPHLLLL